MATRLLMMTAGVLAVLVVAGCASSEADRIQTGSLGGPKVSKAQVSKRPPVATSRDPAVAAKVKWCQNRYAEALAGKSPGGATSQSEKVMHDIECAAVGVGGRWKAENATRGL